ncbi:MAG: 5'/3'-nucleotidase SurE [Flavobacteriia bacterium]|nr:5'/3'-nucleotidase SurE [Flavobacteriia bacterium]
MSEKLILITNDDSVNAKGIRSLIQTAKQFGRVVVVAPDKAQSGMGHAITINHPLRLHRVDLFDGIESYACSGTPVDCVKLAIYEVLKCKPDLLLSGINHGENTSTNVLYSGTMSAAIEGAMEGIPSIGFSLADYASDADFSHCEFYLKKIIHQTLMSGLSANTCLNVNIPKLSSAKIKGIRVCTQAHAFWADRFDKRLDQFGNPYFWLTGDFAEANPKENTDLEALKNGYVSIVPTHFDLTNYESIKAIEDWKL